MTLAGVCAHRRSEISGVGEQFKFTEPTVRYFSDSRKYVLTRHDDAHSFLLCNQKKKVSFSDVQLCINFAGNLSIKLPANIHFAVHMSVTG